MQGIDPYRSISDAPGQTAPSTVSKPAVEKSQAGFGEQVTGAINHVNDVQQNADAIISQVTSGNPEDAHKAVIVMEHALMALDFTLQIRNKVLDAYQEIMKTQL
ncbi:MAG TPA: flagellar hook-basal body complex protein FliE [Armatimonadota bacterium]|jgi:flagellar hook-basal body complex protein FliE